MAVRRSRTGMALLLGWLFTVTFAYTTGTWLPRTVTTYYQQSTFLGFSVFFAVSSLMAAPYVMAFAVCYQRLARLPGAVVPLLTAAAWVPQEAVRVRMLTGNPWATFGYAQVGVTPLVQIADITGVYRVSFVLVAVNVALAELALRVMAGAPALRPAVAGCGVALTAVAGVVGYGVLRLHSPDLLETAGPPVPVAIVQGNLDLGSQWRSEFYGRNLDAYLRLTQTSLAAAHPRLVFWPESSMTFFVEDEPLYRAAIGHLLHSSSTELLAGGPRQAQPDGDRFFNSAFLIAPDGQVVAAYDKQHLLPFAEYFPFPQLDFLRQQFERIREFTAGAVTPPLPSAAGHAGILICNEVMFPELATARVAAGATYLVNLANDTWLGERRFSEQVFDMAALRAVEQRRYIVRTSTAGPSGIIDPFGRAVATTPAFAPAWVSGTIAPRTTTTPYHRYGDLFAGVCALACALASVAGAVRRQRTRTSRSDLAHADE